MDPAGHSIPQSWSSLDPDPTLLFKGLSRLADQDVLSFISASDIGGSSHAIQNHLRQLLRTGILPVPLEWCPREAISLARYADPRTDLLINRKADPKRGHAARLLCAAALLRALPEPDQSDIASTDDVARVATSALALGKPHVAAARRFLAWSALQSDAWDRNQAYPALGAVLLSIGDREITDPALASTADWVIGLSQTLRQPRIDRWSQSSSMDHPEAYQLWIDLLHQSLILGSWRSPAGVQAIARLRSKFLGDA
jgi:hypothetical protein